MPRSSARHYYLMGSKAAGPAIYGTQFFASVGRAAILRLVTAALLALVPVSQVAAGDGFTTYGDVTRYALPAGAAILSLAKDDTHGLAHLFATGAVTLGATYALKHAIDDTRPNGGRRSFPSGHTAWAFTGAAYIHHRYGWEWGVPAEIAAAGVAISRIDGNYHRWRDVIASAVLAHASAYFLVDRFDERVSLTPMIGGKEPAVGIAGVIRF